MRDNTLISEIEYRISALPESLADDFNILYQRTEGTDTFEKIVVVLEELSCITKDTKYKKKVEAIIEYICHQRNVIIPGSYIPESDTSNDGKRSTSFVHNQSTNPTILYVWLLIGVLIVLVSMSGFSFNAGPNEVIENQKPDKLEEWEKNIRDLKKEFPSQNNIMWVNFLSGIKTIVTEKPVKPSVFLLLYEDKRTSNCLARKVGKTAVKLLGESSQEPIVIRGEDLKTNKSLIEDYGLFMETYKEDIERKHVMIVLDLQEIPAVIAQTFHSLCDVENPLVHDAAFLFTMQINGNEKLKPTILAEKNLKKLWKDSLDIDIMDPLITRVTNSVLLVEWEARLPC